MLTRQVKNDYAAIVDTPELQAIREKQAELTGRTAELLEVTADLDQFYSRDDAPVRGLFSGIRGGEFADLMNGVELSRRILPETGEMVSTLTIDENPAANPNIIERTRQTITAAER